MVTQRTFGGWTFVEPGTFIDGMEISYPVWVNGKTGAQSIAAPDAALKAAAKEKNAVETLMWMTGGDFSRVKALGLLGDNADWNALGEMGAAHQAAQDSDFTVKELALPTAAVIATALGAGPAIEGAFGLGGAELAGAAGTDALLGSAGADTLAAGGASGLSEAELAAMIESGTVGAEGAALEAGALGSAAGGATGGTALSGGGAGTMAGGGALSKLSDITGLDEGTLELLGIGAGTGLGIYGADQKADALTDIANQSREDRDPFRKQSLAWLNDPNLFLEGPGKTAVDSVLRRLSVKGNPAGMPSSINFAGDFALNSWLNAVTGMGNLGLSGEDTRAQLQAGAADADSQKLDAIGYGLGQVTTPRRRLGDILNSLV